VNDQDDTTGNPPPEDDRERQRLRRAAKFILTDVTGITVDGLSPALFLARPSLVECLQRIAQVDGNQG
jgi:hypothetical protein